MTRDVKESAGHGRLRLAGVAALLLAMSAAAQTKPPPAPKPDAYKDSLGKAPSAEDLKPTGPIDITADRLESVIGSTSVYTGNVKLVSNTLKMDGDRLELREYGNRQYEMRLTGNPGHASHAGAGPDNPPMDAHAKAINYDMRNGNIDLIGDAYVKKGTVTGTAETIRYNVLSRSIDASRGSDSQVHFTIPPASADETSPPPADDKKP
jgi:lipopolysaccharide transport protein LptA